MTKSLDRVADAGGILFVLLVGVGYAAFVAPFMPESLSDPDGVVAHLRAHPPTARFWTGVALESAGLLALVLLAARLAGLLRGTATAVWAAPAVVGLAVASFAVKLGSFSPSLAALHVDRYDPEVVTALLDINEAAYNVSWGIDGAFAALLGLAALVTRTLPRWLAATAVLAGAAIAVGLVLPSTWESAQLPFLAWLLAASAWLLRTGARQTDDRMATARTASPAHT